MELIRLFVGWEPREAIGWHVFAQSAIERSSLPIQLIALSDASLASLVAGWRSEGTNAFSKLRFLIPHLCGYSGWALFADGADMLCRADLAELWRMRGQPAPDGIEKALWCVKHDYRTRHSRKYVGTELETDNADYPRKNWASLFLIDCGSPFARLWHPELLAKRSLVDLLQLRDFHDDRIGALDPSWNHLVGEDPPRSDAKLVHFTLGIPGFQTYKEVEYADEWREVLARVRRGIAC